MARWPAVLLANVVQRADVGMIQGRGGSGLAFKTADRIGIGSDLVVQELESDKAAETEILGLIDNPHTPAAELLDNAVMGDRAAGQI